MNTKNSSTGSTKRAAEADLESCVAGRELDALVAERVMGWKHVGTSPSGNKSYDDEENDERYLVGMSNMFRCWSPSNDIAAAYEMESRIAEMNLISQYTRALADLVAPECSAGETCWRLVHATAEQRCRAALAATNQPST
jgi:hypothetical protein